MSSEMADRESSWRGERERLEALLEERSKEVEKKQSEIEKMVAIHQTEVEESGRGWEAKMDSLLSEAKQLHKTKMVELERQYMAKLESERQKTRAQWEERAERGL